jgi:prepilin-type N-terminal cleavage/methylation domain-containing protein
MVHRHLTRHDRSGFTLPEILIVIVIISVLALVAIPRFSTASSKRHLESARMRVMAALVTARQAAIQKGTSVTFTLDNTHTVRVKQTSGDTTNLVSPVPLNTLYKVTADGSVSIEFNSRGFSTSGTSTRMILERVGVGKDTLTVSKTGMVMR